MVTMTKKEFLRKALELVKTNITNLCKASFKEDELTWKDTIQEIARGDKYMIIQYCKGDWLEFHIHTIKGYNEETKEWSDGEYAYTLDGAFATYLDKTNSDYIKGERQMRMEREYGLYYTTLCEIAEKTVDLVKDTDDAEYVWEDLDFDDKKRNYFGIEESEEDDYED